MFIVHIYNLVFVLLLSLHYLNVISLSSSVRFILCFFFVFFQLVYFFLRKKSNDNGDADSVKVTNPKGSPPSDFDSLQLMKDLNASLDKKKELEKIEMVRQLDNVYRLDHAVTANQKTILNAFGLDANHIKYYASELSKELKKAE